MAQLTGLSADYILRSNLRVDPGRFRRELLRDRHQIIGRIDSRYLGTEPDLVGEAADYDPQGSAITGGFVGALNDYLFARPRLQDAAHLPAEQLCARRRAATGTFSTRRPMAASRSPTPAPTSPTRCGRTRA